jgi:mono/diheme cytochrome c family protein
MNRRSKIAMLLVLVWTGAAAAGQTTVQDKVYSQAQARQGLAVYDKECASCHDGGTMGPELWGDAFVKEWKGRSVSALFDRIDQTMPAESPGTLSDQEVLDVIGYVLQQNGFPPGEKAIADVKSLAGVQFVAP